MKPEYFKKTPIAQATTLPETGEFIHVIRDRYWAVTDDDCILAYKGYSRQCNSNEGIVQRLISSDRHPGVKVVFLPLVFLPHNCRDYV
jgi:hypothetical protein